IIGIIQPSKIQAITLKLTRKMELQQELTAGRPLIIVFSPMESTYNTQPWSLKKLKQRLYHLKLEEYDVIYEADLIKAKPKAEEVAG
ncbi:hypothetical protein OPU39_15395, partial [Acinetobacter nosocomialis]|nr:hypothetical protein [Acinetobacter nosocomialis]